MSETDPYAAPDAGAPAVYNLPAEKLEAVEAAAEEQPVVEPENPAEPETDEAVPEGTIADVTEWVGTDADRAARALAAEEAGQKRKSLIKHLKTVA